MAAVTWAPNRRLNSYRATIGQRDWALTLQPAGWFLEDPSGRMTDVFVASVDADRDTAFKRAIPKARNVA